MVLSGVPRKKSPVTPQGVDPGTVRLVAQCLNHYATPGPTEERVPLIFDENHWPLLFENTKPITKTAYCTQTYQYKATTFSAGSV